jgi:predicted ArsR family transcriptional regulator
VKTRERLEEQLDSVELLGDPVRRALYLHVAAQPVEVSRDQAAAAVRVSRELAAFHLDKLVGAKLLEPVYRRLSGRTGPGAGRPAKLYRRAAGEIEISLPQREYQLASRIFARALRLANRQSADEQLDAAARELGAEIGRQVGRQAGPHPSQQNLQAALLEVLSAYGYQPFNDGERVRLSNCPFHALAQEFRQPVCGMNLAFLDGIRVGAGISRMLPELHPTDGYCCVSFRFPDS